VNDSANALADRIEREFGQLFSAARMPIVVLRRTGEIVGANAATTRTYGYSREELLERRIHDLNARPRDVEGEIGLAMKDAPPTLARRPHRTRDGAMLSVLPSAFPIVFEGMDLLVSFLQDVTSLDAAEELAAKARDEARDLEVQTKALRSELLAAERLASIGRVAAGIAHELNNPAALVTMNLGMIRDRLRQDPAAKESIAMLDECVDGMARIRDIVQQVRGFSSERPTERVDLSRLAANVMRMVRFDVETRATVDARFEPDVFAKVRGSRVSQVLTNLLINAVQAIPDIDEGEMVSSERAHIVLRTFRAGAEACIEVSDNGPGVPADLADRIFDPFFTTRAGSGGTGLGLWLARGIVEEEGGTLGLSERAGGGAVFRISLPGVSA
jgi:PAS domain S-box-containing protein